ncbi:MAG: hypothetical protein EB127_09895 [Alphaproteobacteria bacterium]|nr:hypothetical protein [Alphaproteobacteria bacterium]
MINLVEITIEACKGFINQKKGNVGLIYEIVALFNSLRKMGLTNDNLDKLSLTINSLYEKMDKKNSEKLRNWFVSLRNKPVGSGLYIDGKRVVNIRNTTQTGDDTGIDDLIYILDDGSGVRLSVHCGSVHKDGTIKKCVSNPTSKRFGTTLEMRKQFDQIAKDAKQPYIEEMTAKHSDMSTWKNIPRGSADRKTKASEKACSEVAKLTVDNFLTLPQNKQDECIKDIMRITSGKPPCNYSIIVSEDLNSIRLFKVPRVKIDTSKSKISLSASGIYIEFVGSDNKVIGKTQVKFNDGVWREHKNGTWTSSSIHTSWDSVCNLTDLFDMEEIKWDMEEIK